MVYHLSLSFIEIIYIRHNYIQMMENHRNQFHLIMSQRILEGGCPKSAASLVSWLLFSWEILLYYQMYLHIILNAKHTIREIIAAFRNNQDLLLMSCYWQKFQTMHRFSIQLWFLSISLISHFLHHLTNTCCALISCMKCDYLLPY